jgi:hypothetical protein
MPPDAEPDEALEWLAVVEELDLPLGTVGLRWRIWQEPPGALISETARFWHGQVEVRDRRALPHPTAETHLGPYLVAVYLLPAAVLEGPQAPPLWAIPAQPEPVGVRWVRQTVRYADSPVALEARWRAIGQERLQIIGLTETTPTRDINRAWAGLPLLREYQGIGQTEEGFRQRVRDTLAELGQRPSNFRQRLSIRRLATASGFSRQHFTTCLTRYGIDRLTLTNWRPGRPMPV